MKQILCFLFVLALMDCSGQPQCKPALFNFHQCTFPYPATVEEANEVMKLKYKGNGIFVIDSVYGSYKYDFLSLHHRQFMKDFDRDPLEKAEDNFEENVNCYSFKIPAQIESYESIIQSLEKQTGIKSRTIHHEKDYQKDPLWKMLSDSEKIDFFYEYIRINECISAVIMDVHKFLPPQAFKKLPPRPELVSIDFFVNTSDEEIFKIYGQPLN